MRKARRKVPNGKSRKLFRRTVNKTHKFNTNMRPMRGGTRL